MSKGKLGIVAVSSFVVANMIGTGLFTSLGFQLLDISNLWAVLLLWLLGGFLAFCGALVYAELGSVMPRSGGEDTKLLKSLSKVNKAKVPTIALWIQCTIALGFILTASFSQIIIYSGFVLNLCTMLATLGLFIHRFKKPNVERPFKAWGYPVLPGIFLLAMLWILIFLIVKQPVESLYGALTAGLGSAIYFVNKKYTQNNETTFTIST